MLIPNNKHLEKKMLKAILAILLISVTHFSFAGQLSNSYEKCMKDKKTNQEWQNCTNQEVLLQEKLITKAWEDVKKYFKDNEEIIDSFDELLNEQRVWVKYKDAACEYYLAEAKDGRLVYGREGVVLHYGICKALVISDRVFYLQDLKKMMD